MKTEVMLTAGQKQVLKWLKNEYVFIEVINGRYHLTKFGFTVKYIKQAGFDAIRPYLHEFSIDGVTKYKLAE